MAGVPAAVLNRATAVLAELEQRSQSPTAVAPSTQRVQLTLFDIEDPPVVKALQKLDVNRLTPVEALGLLDEWKRKFGK
jgi:DNA mismatch repair protein MutS